MNFTSETEVFSSTEYSYDDFPSPCIKNEIKKFGSHFLPVIYSLVFIFGLVGNTLVVWVLIQFKRLKSMTDIFLLNLAISDLLFVFSLPFWAHYASNEWLFGSGMCKLLSYMYLVGFFSSILFIMLMSIDRYLAIVHAVFALKARTIRYSYILSIVVWTVAFLVSLPELVFNNEDKDEQNQTICVPTYPTDSKKKWKLFCNFEVNLLGLLIPLGIMSFCYFKILRTLWQSKTSKKFTAAKIILIVMIVFFIFWTPYNVALFLHTLQELEVFHSCESSQNLDFALQLTENIAYIHCCLNPVIYAFVGEKFKKYLYKLCQSCLPLAFICKRCQILQHSVSRASSFHTSSSYDQDNSAAL
uniref:C-C motif chemokine receptor 8 n=1 Tax=Latimeria chalumnae TaxID=7897 RepID=H3A7J6_LATCH|nr:PREDICTED: C-C chemokine receptor type 4-like [Latimeria chalumnae]XP_014348530.1 PREDICTED: C-C chemokine receptor type 4-like [Latimeria chalumnae]XP_014348531.1 PREDICTED: C-C chemokine receptor type 4-like [Latimeria chalumnae]|eukprot:XP_006003629.1 PREDICTED: C-C chemokine receptor type 4-like [Latimeria chalumnae]